MSQQQDWRTLREFYPDPELRHRVHYAFAHIFLPRYVRQNPHGFFGYLYDQTTPLLPMEPTLFIHTRWYAIFEPRAGLVTPESVFAPINTVHVFRRVSDLSMSLQTVSNARAALVQMPAPERATEAYFVCVVDAGPAARVFTLEAECPTSAQTGNQGLVCEWTAEGRHDNFGLGITVDSGSFLRSLEMLLRSPDLLPRASFTRSEDGSRGFTLSVRF